MAPPDPKHLAEPRGLSPAVRYRALIVAAGSLLMIGIAAVVAVALATSGARPGRTPVGSATSAGTALAPPTTAARAAQGQGKEEERLIVNPSFEASVAGWRPIGGAVLERVPTAKEGRWSLRLVGGRGSAPAARAGIEHAAVPVAPGAKVNQLYEAVVWVQASKPGTAVQVNVVEYVDGRRFAVDAAGTTLGSTSWRKLEVYHYLHRVGSKLVVEVVAPALGGGASMLVDAVTMEPEAT